MERKFGWEAFVQAEGESLLATYERLRTILYGGTNSFFEGICVPGIPGTSNTKLSFKNSNGNYESRQDWIAKIFGVSVVPMSTVRNMPIFLAKPY